ncbi:hypothetical protein BV22DRAFT_1133842 [Leucogyrophana mollusca]|uniref:Uncharacterized protein n=1 Tax=Leucogyrophana mollusca TaxID=85980 RepID=A0ACB8B2R4_9AGAM|nr:hypothetical protein BV22DRAFT_1133842 [Leucogyrophana mollusca]
MDSIRSNLAALNVDVLDEILQYLTFEELQKFASLCRLHRTWMKDHINHRKLVNDAGVIGDAVSFNNLLRDTSSVVAGDIARDLFYPPPLHLRPADHIQMHVTASQYGIVQSHLALSGFRIDAAKPEKNPLSSSSIDSVFIALKANKRITIFVSTQDVASRTVFEMPTTLHMNWLSADVYFSAYPNLLRNHRGLTKSLAMRDGRLVAGVMREILYRAECGDSIETSPQVWDSPGMPKHTCTSSPDCLHCVRHTDDSNCLWVHLDNDRDVPEDFRAMEDPVIMWTIGGDGCNYEPGTGSGGMLTVL